MRFINRFRNSDRPRPLYKGRQTGASGILLALGISSVMLLVVGGIQVDTERSIEFNQRLNAKSELRKANQSAIETLSQLLESGDVTVPLAGDRKYRSNQNTKSKESQDSRVRLTNWQVAVRTAAEDWIGVVKDSKGRQLRMTNCAGRRLDDAERQRALKNLSGSKCARKIYTDIYLKDVRVTQHIKGTYTSQLSEAKQAQRNDQAVRPIKDGYAIRGLVRRNLYIEAITSYDSPNRFAFGAISRKYTHGKSNSAKSTTTKAVLSVSTDVQPHGCRWLNPNWQESVEFIPPYKSITAAGKRLYAKLSPTLSHGGGGGLCSYHAKGRYAGGKLWQANVCGLGTTFYIRNPHLSSCSIGLRALRPAGNYIGGCFAPGTKIAMADGNTLAVEDLKAGDQIFNPVTKQAQEVRDTRMGYESEPLIAIGYGSKIVKVTQNHPFVMAHGRTVQARSLRVGDAILGQDGKFHGIEHRQELSQEPFQWVYNLTLKADSGAIDDHVLLADGMVTGDHFLQTQLEGQIFAESGSAVDSSVTDYGPALADWRSLELP